MLKIKDNVDLKELEKFGFDKTPFGWYMKNVSNTATCYVGCEIGDIWFDKATSNRLYELDILFDLIQAGFVEKVKGEK